MPWYKDILIEVVNILERGKCPAEHQVGDKFSFAEERGKICPSALNVLFPYIIGLQSGGSFPWEDDPDNITVCCPDYKNPVVFKITRIKSDEP
ncbi:MAG: TIGR04076 family protein [Candidatus Hodarchaeota archaeon]